MPYIPIGGRTESIFQSREKFVKPKLQGQSCEVIVELHGPFTKG